MRVVLAACLVAITAMGCSLPLVPTSEECPAALLSGVLAPDGDGGALVVTEFGEQPVQWPDGYRVERAPQLRLVDEAGEFVAREGDTVHAGGGFTAGDELFIACGYVSTDPP